jgi:hypothetical protein
MRLPTMNNIKIESNKTVQNNLKLLQKLAISGAIICNIFPFTGIQIASAQEHVTIKSYQDGDFARGWTHEIKAANGILWYNSQTGSGAFGQVRNGNHVTIKSYPDDSFAKGWTNVIDTPNGIVWYNSQTGAGAIGKIDSTGNHVTVKGYPDGSFAKGWTNVAYTSKGIVWYNSQTGAGAIGVVR